MTNSQKSAASGHGGTHQRSALIAHPEMAAFVVTSVALMLAGALNATLIFDDLFLFEWFSDHRNTDGVLRTLGSIFLNLDLTTEYRTYGLSRALHFCLWLVFGPHAWAYGALVGLTQAATALCIYSVLYKQTRNRLQAAVVAAAWAFSPFWFTSCFHHYSYLILPYQITFAGAWLFQSGYLDMRFGPRGRLCALGALGVAIGLTGETHLAASVLILTMAALTAPAARSTIDRVVDAAIPLTAMIASIAAHHYTWTVFADVSAKQRFTFGVQPLSLLAVRTLDFMRSVPAGLFVQAEQMAEFGGASSLLAACAAIMVVAAIVRRLPANFARRTALTPLHSEWMAPGALALIFFAGLVIVWATTAFTTYDGSAYSAGPLPRRYGYVPNTLLIMAAVAFLAQPRLVRAAGPVPLAGAMSAILALWFTLHAVCLPNVRAQDAGVWARLRSELLRSGAQNVLFVNTWSHYAMPDFINAGASGLRGRNFPELFESPMMAMQWQKQYANIAFGVSAGHQIVSVDQHHLRLYYRRNTAKMITKDSLIIVADNGLEPPGLKDSPDQRTEVLDWNSYLRCPAYIGVSVTRGWDPSLVIGSSDEIAIDLGELYQTTGSMLPDKRLADPAPANQIVANYGLVSGDDKVYAPHRSSLGYLESNRHGSFTYRIDFLDKGPKLVVLDLFDQWHWEPGERRIAVDVAINGSWTAMGTLDTVSNPYVPGPIAIKLPIQQGVDGIAIRLSQTEDSRDVSFLNGIRIIPAR